MTRLRVGLVLVLLVSLALGALSGVVFHRLFLSNVPEQWLSSFQSRVTPLAFVGTGLLFGIVIAVWAFIVAALAPSFRGKREDRDRPAA